MSLLANISLLADATTDLPDEIIEHYPHLHIKPAEIRWNDMGVVDDGDAQARRLFAQNSEIIPETSGINIAPKWRWTDTLADVSVDKNTLFVVSPGLPLFDTVNSELKQAAIRLKTQYSDFYALHNRASGQVKVFLQETGTWFSGYGVVVWQLTQLLKQLDDQKVSLTQIRQYMAKMIPMGCCLTIVNNQEIGRDLADLLGMDGLFKRLKSSLSSSKSLLLTACQNQLQVSEPGSLDDQITTACEAVIKVVAEDRLKYPRIIISHGHQNEGNLRKNAAFSKLAELQKEKKFRIHHQYTSIVSQVLLGKSAIHIGLVASGEVK